MNSLESCTHEGRARRARWLPLSVLALSLAAASTGCGGSDSANQPPGPAAGGSGGGAGMAGAAGGGGLVLDSGPGGAGGNADASSDGEAGTGGTSLEGGSDAQGGGGGSGPDAPAPCTADQECVGNAAGPYCDKASGMCGQCKLDDATTCQPGSYCDPVNLSCIAGCDSQEDCGTEPDGPVYCDPVSHKCVNCTDDDHCALGQICKAGSCEQGCTAQKGCPLPLGCCSGNCVDLSTDENHCGTCGKTCAAPHVVPMCVGGACLPESCETGWEDCDKNPVNGCETTTTVGCMCTPGEQTDCFEGPPDAWGVGACKAGLATCNAEGTAFGPCVGQVLPMAETCFTAADDDCDGEVNEAGLGCVCVPNATESCYTGPLQTRNVGVCTDGTWTCNSSGTAWGPCLGQVLPSNETCLTALDENCNGQVNEAGGEGCTCAPGTVQPCYSGPPGTQNIGVCKGGVQTCNAQGLGYGPCVGDVVPTPDVCTDSLDNDCNGVINDGISSNVPGCACFPSSVQACYTGPIGTQNVGVCKGGMRTCNASGASWGSCAGQVIPAVDICTDTLDNDCNGIVNDGFGKAGATGCICTPGSQKDCYTGPTGTINVGVCKGGKNTCAADGKTWGPCLGQVIPDLDSCLDFLDNDCNGVVNDGNHLAPGCACEPGTIKCVNNFEVTCNALGDWGAPGGLCNQICKVGQFNCDCNQVMQCDVGPPAKWVPKSPALICSNTTRCDKASGTCKAMSVVGSSVSTGSYFQYGVFTTGGGVFKGGYDVDSEGDRIFVNRSATYLDEYKVVIADTDGDGKIEPNQHPNNPLETGPVEARTLVFIKSYTKTTDMVPLGTASQAEVFFAPGGSLMYSVGDGRVVPGIATATTSGDIVEYNFLTKVNKVVVHPTTALAIRQVGFDPVNQIWYGSSESARKVWSFCPAASKWIPEFLYPDLAGSHMDGLEVIVQPSTGIQYVYVSDMTSDYLGQYRLDANGNWQQVNLFKYYDVTGSSVEGMGFGALNHFWVTGGSTLVEIGGGDLTAYLQ
jgi:hypothetical protein